MTGPVGDIEQYAFESKPGEDFGSYTTTDYEDAKEYARENGLRIIAHKFEYVESEVLDDFTETETGDE